MDIQEVVLEGRGLDCTDSR